jgi:hypothetical protein
VSLLVQIRTDNGQKEVSREKERALDGRKAMTEYEAQARATREKTARLKALRIAKEAQAQNEAPSTERRPARRKKITAL